MAKTVELLFKNGILADVWESKNGEPRQWGRNETPDRGFVVVRMYGRRKDLPPEWRQFGGKHSRRRLLVEKLSDTERELLHDRSRYEPRSHRTKHTITLQRLNRITADCSDEWEAYREESRGRHQHRR